MAIAVKRQPAREYHIVRSDDGNGYFIEDADGRMVQFCFTLWGARLKVRRLLTMRPFGVEVWRLRP